MKKKRIIVLGAKSLLFLLMLFCFINFTKMNVSAATAVSIGIIDYDKLTMEVDYNSNKLVYYSTDNDTWTEIEGIYNSGTCVMDISWVSDTSDVTLYFKGDVVKTVKSITLPKKNSSFSIKYDKVEGEFTFENAEEAYSFEWRKSTDYHWRTVDIDESSSSYEKFLKEIDKFQLTGATLILHIPQEVGTGLNNVGARPSRDVSVTITKRAAAPTVKVNSSRFTLNTTSSMEYYDSYSGFWIECSSSMSLEELVPGVLYENGGIAASLRIRRAATRSAPYSKETYIKISGQTAPPRIGDRSADVTYYFLNSKLMLQFNNASATNMYEYAIVRAGVDFDPSKASWKTVKSSNILTISSAAAPKDSTVYVRKKGTDADANKGVNLVLASATNSFKVEY